MVQKKPTKAIILIPGFDIDTYLSNSVLDKLQKKENGFESYEGIKMQDNSIVEQLKLEKCFVDIYQLDYSEEIPRISFNEWINVLSSIFLLFYWLQPDKTWLRHKNNQNFFSYKTLAWGLFLASLLFIYWYIFTLSFLLISLANILHDSEMIFFSVISADIKYIFNGDFCPLFFNGNICYVLGQFQHLLTWILVLCWIISVCFFPLITSSLEKAQFVKKYLESEFIRIKIRNKVLKILNTAIVNEDYTEIIMISHSFGVLIAADSMGHALSSPNKDIKFISLGNNLSFLSRKKYNLIRSIIEKCIGNLIKLNKEQANILYWIDYRAKCDGLSAQMEEMIDNPLSYIKLYSPTLAEIKETIKVEKVKVKKVFSKNIERVKKFLGFYHVVYFKDESYLTEEDGNNNISVIERILKDQI